MNASCSITLTSLTQPELATAGLVNIVTGRHSGCVLFRVKWAGEPGRKVSVDLLNLTLLE
jgi:hypothetical protein